MLGPNIIGNTGDNLLVQINMSPYESGAISLQQTANEGIDGSQSYNRRGVLDFDASRSSSIYSASNTVQPQSNQVLIIIKV